MSIYWYIDFKQYILIELGRSTAEGTCQCLCGLNLHRHRQVPKALGKNSLETKLEMNINNGMLNEIFHNKQLSVHTILMAPIFKYFNGTEIVCFL